MVSLYGPDHHFVQKRALEPQRWMVWQGIHIPWCIRTRVEPGPIKCFIKALVVCVCVWGVLGANPAHNWKHYFPTIFRVGEKNSNGFSLWNWKAGKQQPMYGIDVNAKWHNYLSCASEQDDHVNMLCLGNYYEASSWVWNLLSYSNSYHVTDIVKLLRQKSLLHYTAYYDSD